MNQTARTVNFLILFVLGAFLLGYSGTYEETFKKKIDFVPNGFISLQNINGSVWVEGWDQNAVMIEATKKVRAGSRKKADDLLEKVRIEISRSDDEIIIETHLPNFHNSIWDWIFGDAGSASVRYKLYVPRQSRLEISTTNGSIHASDINGQLRLRSTNGKIEARDVAGQVEARTTNGSILAELTRVDDSGDMGFTTTNGSIKVYLPPDVHCYIRAKTTNGSISSDFPLEVQGRFNSRKLKGSINGGGPLVELRTTNGSIKILSRP